MLLLLLWYMICCYHCFDCCCFCCCCFVVLFEANAMQLLFVVKWSAFINQLVIIYWCNQACASRLIVGDLVHLWIFQVTFLCWKKAMVAKTVIILNCWNHRSHDNILVCSNYGWFSSVSVHIGRMFPLLIYFHCEKLLHLFASFLTTEHTYAVMLVFSTLVFLTPLLITLTSLWRLR